MSAFTAISAGFGCFGSSQNRVYGHTTDYVGFGNITPVVQEFRVKSNPTFLYCITDAESVCIGSTTKVLSPSNSESTFTKTYNTYAQIPNASKPIYL